MYTTRTGSGRPLVLVGGVGAGASSWDPIMRGLAAEHEVVTYDLPGQGATPPFEGDETVERYADELEHTLKADGLAEADLVGSSLGGRLVVEMARRGLGGATVALDPGGFWNATEKKIFGASLIASVGLVRGIRGALPTLLGNPAGRTALLAQLSARPWALDGAFVTREIQTLADSPGAVSAIRALANGPGQAPAGGPLPGPMLMVWGARDGVTLPHQRHRAATLYPDARIEVVKGAGHYPHWDQPARTLELVLGAVG